MRHTLSLLQHSARLTLFTRANCSLCSSAKTVLESLGKRRSFEYNEVDVMAEGQKEWKDMYEFDVPVVHVQRVFHTYSKPNIVTEARKLMHRFQEEEVEALIDEAEGHT
ncbi:hypothetical protein MMC26_006316 [Xylographa opegraphella]|nr:hypothetical protein [Xylographa opegraphella]